MRFGAAITILIGVLIGSGYLLADNVHTHSDLADAREQIGNLTKEINALQKKLDHANSELIACNAQNDQFEQQVTSLKKQIIDLQDELLHVRNHNNQLQVQIDLLRSLDPVLESLGSIMSQSHRIAYLIPVLPASLVITIVIYRYKLLRYDHQETLSIKSKRTMTIQVTEAEMKEIIRLRRLK